jgi:hypothetical protein
MPSELLLAGLLLGLANAAPPPTETIERVVAVVDRRPVLLTEVGVMRTLKGVTDEAALDILIDEMLMYAEARRYPQARPTEAEEVAAVESLRQPGGTALASPDLLRVARRQVTILKYVGLRFRPLVHVSDEALRGAYKARTAIQTPAPTFEEAAPGLREKLVEGELDVRIEEWARQLRSAADIRYVGPAEAARP